MARKKFAAGQSVEGSTNPFADLGFPDADVLLAKAELARQIGNAIDARGLTGAKAAELLGTDPAKVSKILHSRLEDFSIERLMVFLTRLDKDVQIAVRNHPAGTSTRRKKKASAFGGRLTVKAA